MAKISQKELEYLKQAISPEQLIDLVSIKSKINKRQIKLGRKVNESVVSESESNTNLDMSGFQTFLTNLDPQSRNKFESIFSIFSGDDAGNKLQGKIYNLFQKFLSTADKFILNSAE